MKILSQQKIFYVYQYIREFDSIIARSGTPYYIGKGKGHRDTHKKHRINLPANPIRIQRIASNMNEADAFQLEICLIYLFGRIDTNTGILRNLTAGGDGSAGYIRSAELIQRGMLSRSKNPKNYISYEKMKATIASRGSNKRTAKSYEKGVATKRYNGITNGWSKESSQKAVSTRIKNGSYVKSKESLAKGVATRRANGNNHRTPETIAKYIASRKRNKELQNNGCIKA